MKTPKTFEAITIPRNHKLFAHFLHRGDTYAFAIPPENEKRMLPYQTIYVQIPSWEDQFCKVISQECATASAMTTI